MWIMPRPIKPVLVRDGGKEDPPTPELKRCGSNWKTINFNSKPGYNAKKTAP